MSMLGQIPLVSRTSTRPQAVLVVDGSREESDHLSRELRLIYGPLIRIRHAGSGGQALDLLRQTPFELVLIDYHLPDIDALELLAQILDFVDQTAIVLMTRQPNDRLAAEALRQGAADYFAKQDLGPAELEQLISQALRTTRVERLNIQHIERLRRDRGELSDEIRNFSRRMNVRLASLERQLRQCSLENISAELHHMRQLVGDLSRIVDDHELADEDERHTWDKPR